jgi:mono/diheme cytochrome c family protein
MKRYLVPLFALGAAVAALPATALSDDNKKPLYTVVDGYKVDDHTYEGFKTWRAAACDRCHGPNQEGMVGPSLIDSLKVLSYEQFKDAILNGRLEKGMPNWSSNEKVVENLDALYAYLKGRSDGEITKARVRRMDK